MRKIVLFCLVVMLIGNIGIVSAEINVLNFEHKTSNVAITKTWNNGNSFMPHGQIMFENIANYASVSKIVISDERTNKLNIGGITGDYPEITQLETSFILRTKSGVQVGKGTHETYRFISDGVSTGSTEILYIAEWDIGSLSGNNILYYDYGDPQQIVYHTIGTSSGISSSPNEGYVLCLSNYGHKFALTVRVYNEYNFDQDLYYNYDDDLGQMDITLERNNFWSNLTLLYNTTNEVITISKSADNFNRLHILDGQAVKVILTNSMGVEWSNVIPSGIQYDFKKEPKNPVLGNVTSSEIDINAYRASIIALPLIGNMSEPYLDFVDDMYTDAFAMGKTVIDTLMYPVDLVNYNMITVTDILQKSIDDFDDRFGILTAPMTKIIVAIPEKVMGFFVFALGLDIIKIILAWRV